VRAELLLRQNPAGAQPILDLYGAIDTAWFRENFPDRAALKSQDGVLDPEAIAENCWLLHRQPRSAWTHELDLRPWIESW
jgi:hypothetical protein